MPITPSSQIGTPVARVSLTELKRLSRNLIADGVRCLVFSFHSPSIHPGCTPYVNTTRELERFLDKCQGYFEYFFGDLGGQALHPLEVKARLENGTGQSSSLRRMSANSPSAAASTMSNTCSKPFGPP